MSESLLTGINLPVRTGIDALVRERTRQQSLISAEKRSDLEEEQSEESASLDQANSSYHSTKAPALILTDDSPMMPPGKQSVWKSRIPAGAVFYDEMASVEKGLTLPGLLVSVRI